MPVTDFHAYFQPPRFINHLRRRKGYPKIEQVDGCDAVFTAPGAGRPIHPEQINVDLRIELMDRAGVDTQVLRLQNVGGIDAFEASEAVDMARSVNEDLAEIARHYPGRFVSFASVPLQEPERACEEARYAITALGHCGVGASCHLNRKGLDDPSYGDFLQTVEALGVPLILLPNHPPLLDQALQPYQWLAGAFGFQVDLTWAVMRLLASGVAEKLVPDLVIIVANLGGVLTSVTERLDEYWRRVHIGSKSLNQLPSQALRRFYFETASAHPSAIATAALILGSDRLLFGSDYPSFALDKAMRNVLDSGLSETEVQLLLSGNASIVLPQAHAAAP